MSNTLCTFETIPKLSSLPATAGKDMSVAATAQGEYGNGVQFTIGMDHCMLSEPQVKLLISILQKRLRCQKGYAATDNMAQTYCKAGKMVR